MALVEHQRRSTQARNRYWLRAFCMQEGKHVIESKLMTPSELAARWGVTTGHLANLRHRGEGLGYLKIGSRVAYRPEDVLAYEESVYVPMAA